MTHLRSESSGQAAKVNLQSDCHGFRAPHFLIRGLTHWESDHLRDHTHILPGWTRQEQTPHSSCTAQTTACRCTTLEPKRSHSPTVKSCNTLCWEVCICSSRTSFIETHSIFVLQALQQRSPCDLLSRKAGSENTEVKWWQWWWPAGLSTQTMATYSLLRRPRKWLTNPLNPGRKQVDYN